MTKDKVVIGEEGMIWGSFDTKKPLVERIQDALDYFKEKYDAVPAIVFINHDTLGKNGIKINGIKIIPDNKTLKNNFYIFCKKKR